jgi:hypothetical protein
MGALDRHNRSPTFWDRLQLIAGEKRIGHLYVPHDVAGSARNLGHVINFRMDKLSDPGFPFLRLTVILDTAPLVLHNEDFKIIATSTSSI